MSNYPDGVTDAHPHFNPSERPTTVDCTTEEALVVPLFAVQQALIAIHETAESGNKDGTVRLIAELQFQIDEIKRESDYECQWVGEIELPVSEEAHWDCPRCGVEQTTDTLPDEDPDRGWDDERDSRYDD
jgi:hypothetical protein